MMVVIPGFEPRLLSSSTPRLYGVLRAYLRPSSRVVLRGYSGKLVKTLLIRAEPGLEEVFEGGMRPKPIHVSPLGTVRRGRLRYLWSEAGKPVPTVGREELVFLEAGFDETLQEKMLAAAGGLDGVKAHGVEWRLEEVVYASILIPSPAPRNLGDCSSVVVEFKVPASLLDPYKPTRYRRFLPLPSIVFAYNVGELTRILRKGEEYWRMLDALNYLLNETHYVWDTVRRIHYEYEGARLPGLYGKVKYYLYREALDKHPELSGLLWSTLLHASIMGVGTGRAAGFGHVYVRLICGDRHRILSPLPPLSHEQNK